MSAPAAVDAWMGDAPHQNTMLSPNLTEIGGGVAVVDGRVYYVIDCARPTTSGAPQVSTMIVGSGTTVPANEAAVIYPVALSSPNADGDVIHEVKSGQTLWQIAISYEVKIDDIKRLNNLFDDNIYPGNTLLIKKVPTPTAEPRTAIAAVKFTAAPFMHGDALKGMAGMDTSFSMDFWNVDKDSIDWEEFFGDQIAKLDEGHDLVAPYQRTGEDRGKYTTHLIPYKWEDYRIEIEEPDTKDENERKAYYDAALAAFKLYTDAYLISLARLEAEDDQALIDGNKEGLAELMDIALAEDPAAKLGLLLFGDQAEFEKYFLDAFWRAGYYGM